MASIADRASDGAEIKEGRPCGPPLLCTTIEVER